jgi:hypothetical protein
MDRYRDGDRARKYSLARVQCPEIAIPFCHLPPSRREESPMSEASTEADFWHVQLPTGEVRYLSLEELDEAFQRDEVDAKTYVLKQGDTTWQRLGELLGLDEVGSDLVSVPVEPYAASVPPPSGVQSIRPVVSDVDDIDEDEAMAAMKPKRKNVAVFAGAGAALLLLAVVGLSKASGGSGEKTAAAAPPPAAMALPAAAAPVEEAVPHNTLSDDQKRALLGADKAREAKSAARAAENAKYKSSVYVNRTPKSGAVFHKGGSKFDPLNSGN